MRGVPGGLPQVKVEDVGRDDLVILVFPVLFAYESHEIVVHLGAVGEEETRARGQVVEEEQLLVHADDAVVALLGLFDARLVLLHELVGGEGDGVHAHERVLGHVSAPVGAAALVDGHRLDPRGVGEVRPAAQVHHRAAAVARDADAVGQVGDKFHLKLVLRKHLQRLGARHLHALERLLVLDDRLAPFQDSRALVVGQGALAEIAVVIEALLDGRADGEVGAVLELQRFSQHVRGRVPVQRLALGIVEGKELERAVALQRAAHVPVGAVHVREQRRLRQLLVDTHGDVPRGGDVLDAVLDGAVGHHNLDGLGRCRGGVHLTTLAREVLLEKLDALSIVRRLQLERGWACGLCRGAPRGRRKGLGFSACHIGHIPLDL
mmetsp:Transcript_42518/g.68384  ORF Transcript_42518/g.68384 Transcript_42518/m.68384 type:complete len:378 (-) Transcript_42518:121-1254(-)